MDIGVVLNKFLRAEESNIIITDEGGELLYTSSVMDFSAERVIALIQGIDDDFTEQEIFDRNGNMYLKVKKTVIEDNGSRYFCYRVIDESEYAQLIREVAAYSKSISSMSKFQTSIMNKLSLSYDTFLPGLADYCNAREEAGEIRSLWKKALDRLNEEDKALFCSMACGLSYGKGEYDYDDLYANADKQMYENKKELKANSITSHINGKI